MPAEINQTIKAAYNNCPPEEWLPHGDKRYIDLTELGVRGIHTDVMRDIENAIVVAGKPAQLLFSGFRGSGKTTELQGLAHSLGKAGYRIVFVDTEEYLNLRVPATVSDLWVSIAAGFDRHLEENGMGQGVTERFWDRIKKFLDSEVVVSDVKLNIPKVGDFKVALRENSEFREQLNAALETRRPALVRECREFVKEAIARMAEQDPDTGDTVVIVDSFEKIEGDARNADAVRRSVETIFVRDWKMLQTPCHAVYTVPPWLMFTETGADCDLGQMHLMPMPKVAEPDGTPSETGIQAMLDLLGKRMDLSQIFGDADVLRPIVSKSGGYPRDLLRMVREVLLSNVRAPKLPLERSALVARIDDVIARFVEMYDTGLDGNDLPLLLRIDKSHNVTGWPREDKFRAADLFENHFVMSYQNGKRWLALHPLLRDTPSVQQALAEQDAEK